MGWEKQDKKRCFLMRHELQHTLSALTLSLSERVISRRNAQPVEKKPSINMETQIVGIVGTAAATAVTIIPSRRLLVVSITAQYIMWNNSYQYFVYTRYNINTYARVAFDEPGKPPISYQVVINSIIVNVVPGTHQLVLFSYCILVY